jgi:DNA-binding LacI/PurR family transcriptional regulator
VDESPKVWRAPATIKRATIYDVARAAEVSHQTVSRFLSGFAGIRPETRTRVERALSELNYRPNMTARSLKASTSHRIGALAYDLYEVGPNKIVQAESQAARDAGYVLDIVSLDPFKEDEFGAAIDLLNQNDFAGILANAPTDQLRRVLEQTQFSVPLFLDNEPEEFENESQVEGSSATGTRMVVEHLVALGHRRILHLTGPQQWVVARNRGWAYRSCMQNHKLVPEELVGTSWSAAEGFRAMQGFDLDPGITAIVADNDQLALGVLRSLSERGVRVPADVSVVGFDDIPEAEFFIPPLTTIRQDYEKIGRRAVQSLLGMFGAATEAVDPNTTAVSLVVRASSGPPPAVPRS